MTARPTMRRSYRMLALAIGAGAALAAVGALIASATATHFARVVVTPTRRKLEEIVVVDVADSEGDVVTITLSSTADSRLPGRYSLWFSGGSGHARVGEILDQTFDTVTRELLSVDSGRPKSGDTARIGGWVYLSPSDLGVQYSEVDVATEFGPAPAWLIPAPGESDRWAIVVHGRSVQRPEGLRAVPVLRNAGYTSLLVSYRNDGEAPWSRDGSYALGSREWRDVDSAIDYAVANGARSIVLMGWSMGGATTLQTTLRPERSRAIRALILESPVIDWPATLRFHGMLAGVAKPVTNAAIRLLGSRRLRRLAHLDEPIDFAALDIIARANELDLPILLLHSEDDGYVPVAGSARLAELRPDIVRFVQFRVARHTKLWNVDAERWNAAIGEFLTTIAPE